MKIPRLKRTADHPIRTLTGSSRVRMPIGSMKAQVSTGDQVILGTLLAETQDDMIPYRCCHAPLSGTVAITGNGTNRNELVIEGHVAPVPSCNHEKSESLDSSVITAIARNAGLVGMGGAMFPTHVKLRREHPINCVIVNACESEPYLTCDHRVLVEHRDEVECGMRLAMQAVGAKQGIIAADEHDYLDGYEPRLIQKMLGRSMPHRGRPSEVGVITINVQTARALHHAVCGGRPLTDRVITVDGDAVGRPGNYLVPIGTEVGHILAECDVDWKRTAVVLAGGPMMGSVVETQAVITAGTGGVLALTAEEYSRPREDPCIRCGRCQDVCPLALPVVQLIRKPNASVLNCIECGVCQFSCPAQRSLLSGLRQAKTSLAELGDPAK